MIALNEYDIGAAFRVVEDELIKSMIRNMDRHRAEETKEGIEWSMWQAEQLKALEKYKRDNRKRYGKQFQNLNKEIGELIRISRQKGNMQQEIQILNAIRKGFPARKISKGATAEFFKLNERKRRRRLSCVKLMMIIVRQSSMPRFMPIPVQEPTRRQWTWLPGTCSHGALTV